jgi:hypothetical protein
LNRRGLLAGILGAAVAPAFVGSSILMPVRAIARLPDPFGKYGWIPWGTDRDPFIVVVHPDIEQDLREVCAGRLYPAEIGLIDGFRFVDSPVLPVQPTVNGLAKRMRRIHAELQRNRPRG